MSSNCEHLSHQARILHGGWLHGGPHKPQNCQNWGVGPCTGQYGNKLTSQTYTASTLMCLTLGCFSSQPFCQKYVSHFFHSFCQLNPGDFCCITTPPVQHLNLATLVLRIIVLNFFQLSVWYSQFQPQLVPFCHFPQFILNLLQFWMCRCGWKADG